MLDVPKVTKRGRSDPNPQPSERQPLDMSITAVLTIAYKRQRDFRQRNGGFEEVAGAAGNQVRLKAAVLFAARCEMGALPRQVGQRRFTTSP